MSTLKNGKFSEARSSHIRISINGGDFSVLNRKRRIQSAAESEDEYILGTVSFIPNKRRRTTNFRVQISIQQSVINGFMGSLRPTVSFSAMLPNASEVFRKVATGDLDGLRQMLTEGTASLSDCDELGNFLLVVCPSY
jgi:hypothetical protein